ncbi:lipase/acyltransferase domain-containing protein [Leptospira adleri]|uniref:Lecithin--cholesterol acyltransferase n=1 Tax=Leptospira adleri TaxID=2023186 RepID=A0A2M9YJW6_9LEPT|nr:lecithin--cholesterol acyltransferase [Leptospira adleri]PJZ51848.1 lecithin--cholesterol acyltransferase [Leptospira adleri]PJZ59916.1 lecithin--cholesterol acyltransferase [Leptospira adleri]
MSIVKFYSNASIGLILLSFLFCSGQRERNFGPGLLKDSGSGGSNVTVAMQIPLVFVPGYKGSELYRKNESGSFDSIWLTPWQALNFSAPDLTLKKNDRVQAGEVLSSVTLIPFLIDVKVYQPWLQWLSSNVRIRPYVFPYDWRKDNGETSSALEAFLEKVQKENAGVAPVLVGHSNGGNLALSVINRRPNLASKAIFVGVPFRGGIGFMEDLISGVSTGLNPEITGACVVSSFISVYTFFPREGSFDTKELLRDSDQKNIAFRFFNASDWEKYELGPYSHEAHCEPPPSLKEFQSRLDLALAFRNSLDPKKGTQYPPVLVVHAQNRPTMRVLTSEKNPDHWLWDFKNAVKAPGDGRVTFSSSIPPDEIVYQSFLSDAEHSSLLSDPKVWDRIYSFLHE